MAESGTLRYKLGTLTVAALEEIAILLKVFKLQRKDYEGKRNNT